VRARSTFRWFTFVVRVNGVEFYEASLRSCCEQPTNCEVVLRHPKLGCFALHEFLLEILESKEGNTSWRQISLAELKAAILEEAQSHTHVSIRILNTRSPLFSQSLGYSERGDQDALDLRGTRAYDVLRPPSALRTRIPLSTRS
jgi:hypothetical protein